MIESVMQAVKGCGDRDCGTNSGRSIVNDATA